MALTRLPHRTMALNSRIFDDLWSEGGSRAARLPVDIYTTDNEIVVSASLSGISPEDIEISLEDDVLTIRGEIPPRLEDVRYIFAERFHGRFARQLRLNVAIDHDNISASFENGILHLVLPKAEEARPRVIKIQAK